VKSPQNLEQAAKGVQAGSPSSRNHFVGFSVAKVRGLAQTSVLRTSPTLLKLTRHSLLVRQLTSFVSVGALATALHYAVLITAVQLLRVPPVPSALAGYCCGGFLSYVLNRRHTFVTDRPHAEAIWRFALVAAAGFVLTFLMMSLLVDAWHRPYLAAQVVTTGVVMIWNFLANRYWTFALMTPPVR
jgi:putative flippase GtrA